MVAKPLISVSDFDRIRRMAVTSEADWAPAPGCRSLVNFGDLPYFHCTPLIVRAYYGVTNR